MIMIKQEKPPSRDPLRSGLSLSTGPLRRLGSDPDFIDTAGLQGFANVGKGGKGGKSSPVVGLVLASFSPLSFPLALMARILSAPIRSVLVV